MKIIKLSWNSISNATISFEWYQFVSKKKYALRSVRSEAHFFPNGVSLAKEVWLVLAERYVGRS